MAVHKKSEVNADVFAGDSYASEVIRLRARIKGLQKDLAERFAHVSGDRADDDRVNDFAETTRGWFWETDAEHRFSYLSPSVSKITGVAPEWHYGKTREELGSPGSVSAEEWQAHLETINRRLPFSDFLFQRQGPDGTKWLRTSGKPVFDANGDFLGYRGSAADVSTEVEVEIRAGQMANMIEEKNQILETALKTIPDGVQVLDENLNLVAWNDQLFGVLELDGDAILNSPDPGKAFRYALAERGEYGEGDVDELVASREKIARSPVPVDYERQLVTGKWMECRGNPIKGGGYLAVYRDITESRRNIEQLEEHASVDALTGIWNRRRILEAAEGEFRRVKRYERPFSLLLLDIDHFKSVNDSHGHAVGDEVLRCVASACRDILRASDRIGRYGGEEFIVMLPETNGDGAADIAERLRAAVAAAAIVTDTGTLRVTTSVGVAQVDSTHGSLQDTISLADAALYDAKHAGRDRVASR